MMPNMDPRTMKSMLAKMGITTEEMNALKVVIEGPDKNLVIENPQVTKISAQGAVSFQVTGEVREESKKVSLEITDSDIKMVMEKTGVNDENRARLALEAANGDIAEAILSLGGGIQ